MFGIRKRDVPLKEARRVFDILDINSERYAGLGAAGLVDGYWIVDAAKEGRSYRMYPYGIHKGMYSTGVSENVEVFQDIQRLMSALSAAHKATKVDILNIIREDDALAYSRVLPLAGVVWEARKQLGDILKGIDSIATAAFIVEDAAIDQDKVRNGVDIQGLIDRIHAELGLYRLAFV